MRDVPNSIIEPLAERIFLALLTSTDTTEINTEDLPRVHSILIRRSFSLAEKFMTELVERRK